MDIKFGATLNPNAVQYLSHDDKGVWYHNPYSWSIGYMCVSPEMREAIIAANYSKMQEWPSRIPGEKFLKAQPQDSSHGN